MPSYPATNDLAALVVTNPADGDVASSLGTALRETRACLKAVIESIHTSTGGMCIAIWQNNPQQSTYPSNNNTANAWHVRSPWSRLWDNLPIDQLGASNNPVFQPVAGTYLVEAEVIGFKCASHVARLVVLNGDGSVTPINGLSGTVGYSNNGGAYATTTSKVIGLITADGNTVYQLQQLLKVASTTQPVQGTGDTTWAGIGITDTVYGYMKVVKIG